jgi:hypothetical protein
MSNDKPKHVSPDKQRIHVNDPNELRTWATSLSATQDEIKVAVAKVGSLAYKVRERLSGR